jgi:methyltransferase (TIGR00027 family)
MTERRASQTALLIAAYRARASSQPHPLIQDPWARQLAGPEGEQLAQRLDEFLPQRELWVTVRTALLDEQVIRWTRTSPGLHQVVLLGAGLDTRAARLSSPGVTFFEVDHPASQRDKRARLARVEGYPVEAARYAPCDFERDDFLSSLQGVGFRPDEAALVLWEGVTPYLQESAIRSTFERIAGGFHPRTVLLFDHFLKRIVSARSSPPKDERTRAYMEDLGERFVFGTNDPLPMLYEAGFRHVRSVSFDEACLSLTGTYAREREFRFQRLVLASRTSAGSL